MRQVMGAALAEHGVGGGDDSDVEPGEMSGDLENSSIDWNFTIDDGVCR